MIKTKLFGFFVAFICMTAYAFAAVNPDPHYIHVSHSGSKIKLKPHGFDTQTPSRDTRNFQWIFDNYPNADIDLTCGTYHISVTIEAVNYQGTIKGEGQCKTFIVGRGPLVDGQYVFPALNSDLTARLYPPGSPWLFWFHPSDGNVNDWQTNKVSLGLEHFTIRVDGLGPLTYLMGQSVQAVWGLIAVTGHQAVISEPVGNVSHLEVKAKHVTFEAEINPYVYDGQNRLNPNTSLGLLIWGGENWQPGIQLNFLDEVDHGPVNVQALVKDCHFKNLLFGGFGVEGNFTANTGTAYTFPTNPPFPPASIVACDNVFDNVSAGGGIIGGSGYNLFLLGSSDDKVIYKNNKFINLPAVGIALLNMIAESMPKVTSNILIKENSFNHVANGNLSSSILLLDAGFPSGAYYDLTVEHNKFDAEATYNQPFMNVMMGFGAEIIHNSFKGAASSAISIGNTVAPFPPFTVLPAVGNVANNNHFCLTSTIANVVLGAQSTSNVITVKHASDVEDLGTGNTIIVE